jgi:hypothetical protein
MNDVWMNWVNRRVDAESVKQVKGRGLIVGWVK